MEKKLRFSFGSKLLFIGFIALFFLCISYPLRSQVRLPKLISDGMVLQREADIKIWGWAGNHENVSVEFIDSVYSTVADESGQWEVNLPKLKTGGPFTMTIKASNTLSIKNIMLGDVWVCSGQSNMELPMRRVKPLYETEIANADNPMIRYFAVPQNYDFNEEQKDLAYGNWQVATPTSVLNFSAVAYFFAVELYNRNKVPIGLISSNLGGSPAEAWMSEEALQEFPVHAKEMERFKDKAVIDSIEKADKIRAENWYKELWKLDSGRNLWFDLNLSNTDWSTIQLPGYWQGTDLEGVNGVVWFRKEINIPASIAGKPARLELGRIVDTDSVFLNGIFIGSTGYQYPPRRYEIPLNHLKEGVNTLTVKVICNIGNGGFVPDKPYKIVAENQTIDLKGEWKYKVGAKTTALEGQTFVRWKPGGLYNSMISPLLNYRITGVIWYQGESNAERPKEYGELFPAMINDWRKHWNQGDFPFIFVQLANFMEEKDEPSESNWALLREAQLKTLSQPNTGMAVITDIGEWNDIHPLNKKDVGKRLALAAQKVAYKDEKIVFSGPMYQSHEIKKGVIILSFSNVGGGLETKGSKTLQGFAIAGADKKFEWAEAKIMGEKVVVKSKNIAKPIYVRYAWADNPSKANLYNKEGLPASAFRTDGP